MRAAVLRGGRGAALVGSDVLWLHGVGGYTPRPRLIVATPTARRPVRGRDIDPERIGYIQLDIADQDRAEVDGVPAVTLPYGLLDLAATSGRGRTRRAYDAAKRAGLRDEGFWGRVHELPEHIGSIMFTELRTAGVFDQDSDRERLFARDVVTRCTPAGEWQVWVLPDVRVDVRWQAAWLTGEWDDDAWHTLPADREADRARDRKVRGAGYEVARFRSEHLDDPAATVAALQQLLDVRSEFFATEAGRRVAGTRAGGELPRTSYPPAARALLAP
jgi:hypothetical protein